MKKIQGEQNTKAEERRKSLVLLRDGNPQRAREGTAKEGGSDKKRRREEMAGEPNLVLNDLLVENLRAQVRATVQSLDVFLDSTTKLGTLEVRDAFQTRALGTTTVWGAEEVEGALRVDGESLYVSSGGERLGGNLVVEGERVVARNDLEVDGAAEVRGSLFVATGALQANSNAAVVSLPTAGSAQLAIVADGQTVAANLLLVGGETVAGRANLAGGLTTATVTAPNAQISAARLQAGQVLSATSLALLNQLRTSTLSVATNSRMRGPVQMDGSAFRLSGAGASATVDAPIAVRGALSQDFGAASILGSPLTLGNAVVAKGGGLSISAGPGLSLNEGSGLSVAGESSFGRDVRVGGAVDVAATSRTSGAAQLRSAPICQTRVTPASLGRTDVTSLVVRENGDLQVADGRTLLHGDLSVQGNVILDGDSFESHFQTYNLLGPNTDFAQSWIARIDDTTWRGDTWTGNVDQVVWNGINWTGNFSRDVEWNAGRDANWTVGRDATWEVDNDVDWQVNGQWNASVQDDTTWTTPTFTINYDGPEGLVVNNTGGGQDAIVVNNADKISITNGNQGQSGVYIGGDRIITTRQTPPFYIPFITPIPPPIPTPPSLVAFAADLNSRLFDLQGAILDILQIMFTHGLIGL